MTVVAATVCALIWLFARRESPNFPTSRPPAATENSRAPVMEAVGGAGVQDSTTRNTTANPSTSPPQTGGISDGERWVAELVGWLETRGDAESLMTAALVLQYAKYESTERLAAKRRAMVLLHRASELAADDALIAWLSLSLCDAKNDCDFREFEQALKRIDPKNGLGWLGDLTRAMVAGDVAATEQALSELGKREHFDMYTSRLHTTLDRSVREARVPPPRVDGMRGQRLLASTEILASMASSTLPFPALLPITSACSDPATDTARTSCRLIAQSMRQSDTSLIEGMGLRILEQLESKESDEWRAIKAEQRRRDWLWANVTRLSPTGEQMRQLIVQTGRETKAYEALLRQNGVPLDPPVNWLH